MHCKHMGEEIRLNLHISFILLSLFPKVAALLLYQLSYLPFAFGSIFTQLEELLEEWGDDLSRCVSSDGFQ